MATPLAGIKVTGLSNLRNAFEKAINLALGRSFMLVLARESRDLIYKRVKAGYGVTTTEDGKGAKVKLKKLSPAYIRYREGKVQFTTRDGRLVKFNVNNPPVLGEFASFKRSNLTLSGRMLSSMKARTRNFGFTIAIPNTSREGDELTNAEIARIHDDGDRPFFHLTESELKQIKSKVQKQVQSKIRKLSVK
jgi:hypothetical protein